MIENFTLRSCSNTKYKYHTGITIRYRCIDYSTGIFIPLIMIGADTGMNDKYWDTGIVGLDLPVGECAVSSRRSFIQR